MERAAGLLVAALSDSTPSSGVRWMVRREASCGVNKLSVDSSCVVNNKFLCFRCSEHSTTSLQCPQGATTPSVPWLPAPVRVTSPPVCISVPSPALPSISWWCFTGGQTTKTGVPTFYYSLDHIASLRLIMPNTVRTCLDSIWHPKDDKRCIKVDHNLTNPLSLFLV